MNTEALSEREFDDIADATLVALVKALDALDGRVEASLSMGVLTIELEDGGKYIVNSHRAARQIWMAAERSAWHFDYKPEARRWVAAKSGDELFSALELVLSRKLAAPIQLARAV